MIFFPGLDGLPLPTTPSTSCYVLDSRTTPASSWNKSLKGPSRHRPDRHWLAQGDSLFEDRWPLRPRLRHITLDFSNEKHKRHLIQYRQLAAVANWCPICWPASKEASFRYTVVATGSMPPEAAKTKGENIWKTLHTFVIHYHWSATPSKNT